MKWYAYLNSNFPIYLTKVLAQASNNKAMEKGKEDSGVRVGVETVDYHRKRCNPLKLKKKNLITYKKYGTGGWRQEKHVSRVILNSKQGPGADSRKEQLRDLKHVHMTSKHKKENHRRDYFELYIFR